MIEKLFLLLYPYITYTGDAKVVMDSLIELIENEKAVALSEFRAGLDTQATHERNVKHSILVNLCVGNTNIMEALIANNKITAIKHLRSLIGHNNASLVEVKRAVEDDVVLSHVTSISDPWANTNGPADCEQ